MAVGGKAGWCFLFRGDRKTGVALMKTGVNEFIPGD